MLYYIKGLVLEKSHFVNSPLHFPSTINVKMLPYIKHAIFQHISFLLWVQIVQVAVVMLTLQP